MTYDSKFYDNVAFAALCLLISLVSYRFSSDIFDFDIVKYRMQSYDTKIEELRDIIDFPPVEDGKKSDGLSKSRL